MADWYPTIKTIKGRHYLYRQRTWREGGRVRTQSQYVGPIDVSELPVEHDLLERPRRRKPALFSGVPTAIFGCQDEYGQRVDSWWNRRFNKEGKKPAPAPSQEKGQPAEAGQVEKSSFSVVGNGESDEPTATGSQSSSDPSAS